MVSYDLTLHISHTLHSHCFIFKTLVKEAAVSTFYCNTSNAVKFVNCNSTDESKDTITKIWTEHHKSKDGMLSGVVPSMHYAEMYAKGTMCPRVRIMRGHVSTAANNSLTP